MPSKIKIHENWNMEYPGQVQIWHSLERWTKNVQSNTITGPSSDVGLKYFYYNTSRPAGVPGVSRLFSPTPTPISTTTDAFLPIWNFEVHTFIAIFVGTLGTSTKFIYKILFLLFSMKTSAYVTIKQICKLQKATGVVLSNKYFHLNFLQLRRCLLAAEIGSRYLCFC